MNKYFLSFSITFLFTVIYSVKAQNNFYRYSVDLTKVDKDELKVELLTPVITQQQIIFHMPRIVPGTYRNSDFGKFVHDVRAFDRSGKSLPVSALPDLNSWKIAKANLLYKLEYTVEDTWDASFTHNVYEMAGTNFEAGKNFVINPCGVFGYFEGLKKIPFDLNFTRPADFYASIGLVPVSTSATSDIFRCENADRLYDSPIMFCVPDTTVIKVGGADVLVSVYSPKKLITSKFIAENLKSLLTATKNYLGGKLPVNKYAFIYYFNSEQPMVKGGGAWEHSYSSFYSMLELPEQQAIEKIVDYSSHEFFHIVTPLNICSKEVREFDFNNTNLSKHLWLYEGSTEYDAQHAQVTQGLISIEEYFKRLLNEILRSHRYNDTLPFTELSKESAGKYAPQYGNVYQKGALISACLDIYLYKLSGGYYGLKNLKHDLSVLYGPANYFNEEELFDEITKLTFPEIRTFFSKYVEGHEALPYKYFFEMAGVKYTPKSETSNFSLGGFSTLKNGQGVLVINSVSNMNDFGKEMGYQKNDELVSVNNQPVTTDDFTELEEKFLTNVKEGDTVNVVVKRTNGDGKIMAITLSATAEKVKINEPDKLEFEVRPNDEQVKVRNAWLNTPCSK